MRYEMSNKDEIHSEYKRINDLIVKFRNLQDCSNIDFPKNPINNCKNNLAILIEYYNNKISGNMAYRIKLDTILTTYINNYLTSVKSYLNRKKRSYENANLCTEDKRQILDIFEKYRKSGRQDTILDKIISIRDTFEHDEINNISLQVIINPTNEKVTSNLMYKDTNLLGLFLRGHKELESLNGDIEEYILNEQNKINLRHCSLFMNAFHRHFDKEPLTLLFPEETEEEINKYDVIIHKLISRVE